MNNKLNNLKQKNEIICIYEKGGEYVNLLHDYDKNIDNSNVEDNKLYINGRNNINENNIDIYLNDKKIKFCTRYTSKERGMIKVKFIFKKLLNCINHIFSGCYDLYSVDLSSFDSTNVKEMCCMFDRCKRLKTINFSSFKTDKVNNMRSMFYGCHTLDSIDLSSFNTTKVNDMSRIFYECYSLKSIDLSSFNTTNVKILVVCSINVDLYYH